MGLMTARPSSTKFSKQDPYFLDINESPDWQILFGNCQPIKLEIGFGMGDFLIEIAAKEAHNNFVGIDFSQDGIQKLLTRIKNLQLSNIRVAHGDARNKIPFLFQDGKLDTVYINFPDPWPRKRHAKRRLIKPEFVKLIAKKLTPEGHIHLATDSELYAQEMLGYFNAEPLLQNMNQESGFLENRNNLPRTKYEKSFIYADEKIHYLEFFQPAFVGKLEKPDKKHPLINTETSQFKYTEAKPKNKGAFSIEKLENAEAQAKDACDLKKVGDSLATAGNKEWARKVYKKTEDKAQDSLDLNWLAYSIVETLGDKEWARKVFKKAASKAENSLDLNWLAYSIVETLGDKKWAEKLCRKAESKPSNIRELFDLADSIFETLGDKKWGNRVYKKAEDRAKEHSDFYELADIMYEKLGDRQKAMQLYKKAEDTAEDSCDFHSLAECICEKFEAEGWAREVYSKGESKSKDSGDFCGLADSLCKNLGDKEWAIGLYKKAEGKAKESYEYRDLADSLCESLGNIEWAKKLYKKSEEKANAFHELRWLADSLCKNLGDKEWARRVYKKAKRKAKHGYELNYLTKQ